MKSRVLNLGHVKLNINKVIKGKCRHSDIIIKSVSRYEEYMSSQKY